MSQPLHPNVTIMFAIAMLSITTKTSESCRILFLVFLSFCCGSAKGQAMTQTIAADDTTALIQTGTDGIYHSHIRPQAALADFDVSLETLVDEAKLDDFAHRVFRHYRSALAIDDAELRLRSIRHGKNFRAIEYFQVLDGLRIEGTQAGMTVDNSGEIVLLGADVYPRIKSTFSRAGMTSAEAARLLDGAVYAIEEVYYVTDQQDVRRAWHFETSEGLRIIDAVDGSLLRSQTPAYDVIATATLPVDTADTGSGSVQLTSFLDIVATPSDQLACQTVYGSVSGKYWDRSPEETHTEYGVGNITLKLYVLATSQFVTQTETDANGDYSLYFCGAFQYYELRAFLFDDYTRIYDRPFAGSASTVFVADEFFATGSNVEIPFDFDETDSNLFWQGRRVHDAVGSAPFGYDGMNFEMGYIDYDNPYENGRAYDNGVEIAFGTEDDELWDQCVDVLQHEYFHQVVHSIYGARIGALYSGLTPDAMDEGFSDFFGAILTGDSVHDACLSSTYQRDLDNTRVFSGSQGMHWNGTVIGGALWDASETAGLTDIAEVFIEALQLAPKAHTFEDFGLNMIAVDYSLNTGDNVAHILAGFDNHDISIAEPESLSVGISGLSIIETFSLETWYASVSGGFSPYSYFWEYNIECPEGMMAPTCGQWNFGGTGSSFSFESTSGWDFTVRLTVADAAESEDSATKYVAVVASKRGREANADIATPTKFDLLPAFPNPFNPATSFQIDLPRRARATISIVDTFGRQIVVLMDSEVDAGAQRLVWDAHGQPSGVYYARLVIDDVLVASQSLVLLK